MKQDLIINRLYSVVCRLSSVVCQLPSTTVEDPLQIRPFMQNKPNLRKAKMRLSCLYTKDYQNFIPLAGYENKPNSKPIKPNLRKAKMNVNLNLTKNYRKKDDFVVRINKPNFQKTQNERKRFFTKGL